MIRETLFQIIAERYDRVEDRVVFYVKSDIVGEFKSSDISGIVTNPPGYDVRDFDKFETDTNVNEF